MASSLPIYQNWIVLSLPLTDTITTSLKFIGFCIKSWQSLDMGQYYGKNTNNDKYHTL